MGSVQCVQCAVDSVQCAVTSVECASTDQGRMGCQMPVVSPLPRLLPIQLLESPIPTTTPTPTTSSQKASSCNISGTRRGIIDSLVSKRQEKILVPNGPKLYKMVQYGEKGEHDEKWSKLLKKMV